MIGRMSKHIYYPGNDFCGSFFRGGRRGIYTASSMQLYKHTGTQTAISRNAPFGIFEGFPTGFII